MKKKKMMMKKKNATSSCFEKGKKIMEVKEKEIDRKKGKPQFIKSSSTSSWIC
jgi:hypothetical protein